jgi:hypothetical protein
MRSTILYPILVAILLLWSGDSVSATPPAIPCALPASELPVRTTLASAGFFANLRNAEHSINSRMDALLAQARAQAAQVASQPSPCKQSCQTPVVAVVFTSAPQIALDNYDEREACEHLLRSTTTHPIMYANRAFTSEQDAKQWYKDLTQGDGPDGEDLYQRCPGLCSPSYSSTAYHLGNQFIVTTSIICGHARDKDDDQYRLSASLRWLCPR